MQRRLRPRGFTIVEMLVSMGITATLAGLLLPAIQSSREVSRRASCANNLRQIGLAANLHVELRKELPKGVAGNGTYGFSWWVELLPYIDEGSLFDRLDRRGVHCGSPILHAANGKLVDRLALSFMLCPSSDLPPFWPTGVVETLMPSYVGISGATSHDGFAERRAEVCCFPKNDGEISAGGLLVPNRRIRINDIPDGITRTFIVGECSDVLYDKRGILQRIDGGFNYGWMTGTIQTGTPPAYTTNIAPRPYNLTTIRYAPNSPGYERPGVYSANGINNPLSSVHPGGVHVLMMDGSVQFLREDISVDTLKSLATRDDGRVLDGGMP
jgi:prepilin-type N-terminal cleavage/methylation domain-containing protein/prepilin-type processing-associated H-X9-DG protein